MVGIYQTKSLGSGYSLLQDAFLLSGVELIESIPGGGGLVLILKGQEKDLQSLAVKAGADSRYGFHLIRQHADSILQVLYSLNTSGLSEHFSVFETEDTVELFRVAEEAMNTGLSLVEIKLQRGSSVGRGHLILTGGDSEKFEVIRKNLKADARWSLILNRSAKFDQLF